MTDELQRYLLQHSLREAPVARRLRERTDELQASAMASPPEVSQLVALLAQIIDARLCLEIGVFTGYTTLCLALTIPPDGRVVCCDIDDRWPSVGRPYWRDAGVEELIDLRIGPARGTLEKLLREGCSGAFDFAFIDADKEEYLEYYELCLQLVRRGGLVLIDNVLWGGSVTNPANQSADARAVRALNDLVHRDARVAMSLLPIGDGLTLVLRK